jgi:alkylation response protein AidB-like acyl-CoA dehydrogenase
LLWSRSETIWGGSSEIQRGIVAEQLLGCPLSACQPDPH